jgi:phosphopantetheinyl transferase
MWQAIVLHAPPAKFDAGGAASLLERLPYAYRLELERRAAAERNASLLAVELLCGGLLRLRGVRLDPSRLQFPEGGKPRLDGGPWFSVSHARARVAVALSDRCDLGLDLEDIGAAGRDGEALERWTATEATLKAIGAGIRRARDVQLAEDLATALIDGVTVHLRRVKLAPDCVARLGTLEPGGEVVVEEWGSGRMVIGE